MFATFDDVSVAFEGTIPSSREEWVERKIIDAESLLVSLVPSLGDGDVSEARAKRARAIVCDAVLRVYRNPAGATQESDSGMFTVTRSKAVDSGLLYFTPEELASVRVAVKRSRVGTIKVSPWRPDLGCA